MFQFFVWWRFFLAGEEDGGRVEVWSRAMMPCTWYVRKAWGAFGRRVAWERCGHLLRN